MPVRHAGRGTGLARREPAAQGRSQSRTGRCRSARPPGKADVPGEVSGRGRRTERLGDLRIVRHRARGRRKLLSAGVGLFPARHGAFGRVRPARPALRRGFGQRAQTLFGRGQIRIRQRRQARSGRGALLLPGRPQLQAHGRRAAGRSACFAGSARQRRRERPRERVPGRAPLAGRLARRGPGKTGRRPGRFARARPGPLVLRHPPRCDGRNAHRSLPRLHEEGRHDRPEFPGVSRGNGVRTAQVPDPGRRRVSRSARLLPGGHLAASLRVAGRGRTGRAGPRDRRDRARAGRRHPWHGAFVVGAAALRARLGGWRGRPAAGRGAGRCGFGADAAALPDAVVPGSADRRNRHPGNRAAGAAGVLVRGRAAGRARVDPCGRGETVPCRPARSGAAASSGRGAQRCRAGAGARALRLRAQGGATCLRRQADRRGGRRRCPGLSLRPA